MFPGLRCGHLYVIVGQVLSWIALRYLAIKLVAFVIELSGFCSGCFMGLVNQESMFLYSTYMRIPAANIKPFSSTPNTNSELL